MAFRRTTRRSARKQRDLVWINKIVEITATDVAVVGGDIMDSTNWAVGAAAFERATLLAIKGNIMWTQTANATSADVPWLGWVLYKDAAGLVTGLLDPTVAAGSGAYDILHWSGAALASTASGTTNMIQREAIDVKTKRKLDTGDSIYLTTRIPVDTASPTCNVVAQLRFLIDRA